MNQELCTCTCGDWHCVLEPHLDEPDRHYMVRGQESQAA